MKRIAIVGGGLTGLSLAHFLRTRTGRRVEPLVLEAGATPGGAIATEVIGGCLVEHGPEGFLGEPDGVLRLAPELGLEGEVVEARREASRRYIFRRGSLVLLGPGAFLGGKLLTWRGVLRLLGEPFAEPPPAEEETVRAFTRRRLGDEAADVLIDAICSGIFAGDPAALSLASAFPKLHEMERRHRGLVLGAIRMIASGARSPAPRDGTPRRRRSRLYSFRRGLGTVVDALATSLGPALRTGARVTRIERGGDGVTVHVDGERIPADAAVIATLPRQAIPLVEPISLRAADALRGIPEAPVAVVATAFDTKDLPGPVDGYGYLAPFAEGLPVLGTLWSSRIFEGRAEEGNLLLRTMVGGARAPGRARLADEPMGALVREALSRTMGIAAAPRWTRIFRYDPGIPQYTLGHQERVRTVRDELLARAPIWVGGWTFDGVGCNRAVQSAARLLDAIRP